MSTALKQLACMIGTIMAVLVLAIALARGMPAGVALFRAAVVMCCGSVIVAVFFRFSAAVLHTFLQSKIEEQKHVAAKRHDGARKAPPGRPVSAVPRAVGKNDGSET